jgi:hypothetical protein
VPDRVSVSPHLPTSPPKTSDGSGCPQEEDDVAHMSTPAVPSTALKYPSKDTGPSRDREPDVHVDSDTSVADKRVKEPVRLAAPHPADEKTSTTRFVGGYMRSMAKSLRLRRKARSDVPSGPAVLTVTHSPSAVGRPVGDCWSGVPVHTADPEVGFAKADQVTFPDAYDARTPT